MSIKKTLIGTEKEDKLYIDVATKNIFFQVTFDGCGSTFKITKKELKELIK